MCLTWVRATRLPWIILPLCTRASAVECQPLQITWDPQGSAGELLIIPSSVDYDINSSFSRAFLLGWSSCRHPSSHCIDPPVFYVERRPRRQPFFSRPLLLVGTNWHLVHLDCCRARWHIPWTVASRPDRCHFPICCFHRTGRQ